MPSLLYPESAWPVRFGRFVRALQIVAIAGAVGAVGGGAAVLAVMGSGPPHKPTIVGAEGDSAAKALSATKAVGDAKGSPQSGSPQSGSPQSSGPATASPPPAAASPAPAASPPGSGTPQPSQLAAAAAEPAAAAPQNAEPAAAPAASEPDNRAKPTERSVHSRIAKLRARENRRARSVASRNPQERDWRSYDSYRPSQRAVAERGFQTGAMQRGSYPYYDSAPRAGYWGGGSAFSGGWGNGGWGSGGWGN
jgi:hypothetical protein